MVTANLIINIVTVLVAILGCILTLRQLHTNNKLKKANFVKDLITVFRTDVDIKDVFYKIDYSSFPTEITGGSKYEKKLDKLLTYCSYLCYLKTNKNISKDEWVFFDYEMRRIWNNKRIKKYINRVSVCAKIIDAKSPFFWFIDYCKKEFDKK